jgi:hypothetical protein
MHELNEQSVRLAIVEDLQNLDSLTECVLTHAIVVAAAGKRRIKYDGPDAEKIAIQECLDWWARNENIPKRPLLREVHRKMKPVIRLLIQDAVMGS